MSTPRDDDALSWDGDDDPTLDVGEKRAAEPEQPEPLQPEAEPLRPEPRPTSADPGPRAPAVDSAPTGEAAVEEQAARAPLGNVGLVGIGMIAATFLLFAIGWLVAGFRLRDLGLPIPDVTVLALTIGAALAPLVWFVTVLALTRTWRTWQRFLLLILGILLLVPWPFLSLGASA
ncbi:DNA polymerase III subunit gamma/tau [Microbacterium proteolyticum]|mgnify:CR=1 FL=1|uniref:DNA polymerase III subunit gamma/tau n=1 Tax=Microbacterium proteolyticum TaxID=1572644 RepID=UPI0024174638|nr:DNA polymerase III subunit gamma/tau [Microbacterium proteolyticum]